MAGVAEAHSGNRVYPFYELTDEMLEKIDLHDGLIDEWYEIGEPSMTLLDFKTNGDIIPLNPSNLDFRIWLAWHDEPNRIYVAFIISDDEYKNTHDWSSETATMRWLDFNDSITLYLDADHSGGRGLVDIAGDVADEERMRIFGHTQMYNVIAQTVSGPTMAAGSIIREREPRHNLPPYGDAGGGVSGENPTISVIEFFVTPRDAWGDNLEDTPFSELSAHQIIGFVPVVNDFDPSDPDWGYSPTPWHPEAIDDDDAHLRLHDYMADLFLDGLLLPAQETAVESVTWGRIKASLE